MKDSQETSQSFVSLSRNLTELGIRKCPTKIFFHSLVFGYENQIFLKNKVIIFTNFVCVPSFKHINVPSGI